MAYLWRDAADSVDLSPYGGVWFSTQVEAEAWLTATYSDLFDAGVEAVCLYDDDDVLVYGPMPLDA